MRRGGGTMDSTEEGKYAEAVAMHVYLTSRTIMHGRYDSNRVAEILRKTGRLPHRRCCV